MGYRRRVRFPAPSNGVNQTACWFLVRRSGRGRGLHLTAIQPRDQRRGAGRHVDCPTQISLSSLPLRRQERASTSDLLVSSLIPHFLCSTATSMYGIPFHFSVRPMYMKATVRTKSHHLRDNASVSCQFGEVKPILVEHFPIAPGDGTSPNPSPNLVRLPTLGFVRHR